MRRAGAGLLVFGLSAFAVGSSGCSDDDSNGDGAGGSAGSPAGATYSVEQACDLFAEVTCNKAAQCGLVLRRSGAQLVCIDCTEDTLEIISESCQMDLEGPKNAAALDRCLTNTASAACGDVCEDADVPDCAVIGELQGDTSDPVDCDAACISG
jgi:hypothetical protein